MDPLTQGIVGATAAATIAPRKQLRLALLTGFAGGMTADLDVLIRSSEDSLLALQFHRHFTHALIFIPVGGLLTALVLNLLPFLRHRLPFSRLWLFATAGYATSGLIDACTSYGTLLYWPFSDTRVAWNNMPIIDPLYTFGLIGLLVWGGWRLQTRCIHIAATMAMLYPVFGEIQNRRAEAIVRELAASRGHEAERVTAKPSPLSLLLWRGIYRHGDDYYVDAIHLPYLPGHRIYEGSRVEAVDLPVDVPELPENSPLAHDFKRFAQFSDHYLYFPNPGQPLLADLRYALLPNRTKPLWGLVYDPANPDEHGEFQTFREIDREDRRIFFRMMSGRDR